MISSRMFYNVASLQEVMTLPEFVEKAIINFLEFPMHMKVLLLYRFTATKTGSDMKIIMECAYIIQHKYRGRRLVWLSNINY